MSKWKIDFNTHFGVDLVPFEIKNSSVVLDIHSFILNAQTSQFFFAEGHKIDAFCGHHKRKTPKLVIFYDVQISRIKKKIYHVQGQKPFIKCAYREKRSKLMVVRSHMDCRLKIKMYSYLSAVNLSFYLLSFEYPFITSLIVPF